MLSLIFVAAIIVPVALGASELEPEDCNDLQLDECVDNLPGQRQFGLPRNKVMLDRHCKQYTFGMGCLDKWMERCIPDDHQTVLMTRTAGVRTVMALMCNTSKFQKEYLKEQACWSAVSDDLSRCIDELHTRASLSERDEGGGGSEQRTTTLFCCSREELDRCVVRASSTRCTVHAAAMLRRMTRLVYGGAAAEAACSHLQHAHCAAPSYPARPATLAPLLALLAAGRFH